MQQNLTIEEKAAIAQKWISKGSFIYRGQVYTRRENDQAACDKLRELMVMPVADLAFYFDDFMCTSPSAGGIPAKGFTIGKGKRLYWYISPTRHDRYRCLGFEKDVRTLGPPRYVAPDQVITIHYK